MDDRPFLNPAGEPTEQAVQAALGNSYPEYRKAIALAGTYSQKWMFTKSGGWMLKVYDHRKALLYLIPLRDGFKISLTIRENEREAFLCDDELGNLRDQISSSKKYPEGYALQFEIANANDFQAVDLLVRKVIQARG